MKFKNFKKKIHFDNYYYYSISAGEFLLPLLAIKLNKCFLLSKYMNKCLSLFGCKFQIVTKS